jgi:hypothetical protein
MASPFNFGLYQRSKPKLRARTANFPPALSLGRRGRREASFPRQRIPFRCHAKVYTRGTVKVYTKATAIAIRAFSRRPAIPLPPIKPSPHASRIVTLITGSY